MPRRQQSEQLEQTFAEIEVLANEAESLSAAFQEIRKRIVREDPADETVKLLGRWAATFAGSVQVVAIDAVRVMEAARSGTLWEPSVKPERNGDL